MLAQVNIVTGAQPNALLLPRDAFLGTPSSNGSRPRLLTVDNGRAAAKNVRLGIVGDEVVEVHSGLSDGQVVAVGDAEWTE